MMRREKVRYRVGAGDLYLGLTWGMTWGTPMSFATVGGPHPRYLCGHHRKLVIHGWDVARAIGRPYECDDAELDVVNGFVAQIASADPVVRGDAYAEPVTVTDDDNLSYLDRVVALSGRDPHWTAR
jgi:hypothetical protein